MSKDKDRRNGGRGKALELFLGAVIAGSSLVGCRGNGDLKIGNLEYKVEQGQPAVQKYISRPLTYEQFLNNIKEISNPTEVRAWHYDTGKNIALGGFSLSYKEGNVEDIIKKLMSKAKPVEFIDQKFPRKYNGPRKTKALSLSPNFDYAITSENKGSIKFEAMRFRKAIVDGKEAIYGQTALNRDLYLMIEADRKHNRINIYYSAWVGDGPFCFPEDSGYRENDGYLDQIKKLGVPKAAEKISRIDDPILRHLLAYGNQPMPEQQPMTKTPINEVRDYHRFKKNNGQPPIVRNYSGSSRHRG